MVDHPIGAGSRVERGGDAADTGSECSEMDRNVGGGRHQAAVGAEQRARVVEPFLHIDTERCAAQQLAHVGGDRLETAGEELQFHGVRRGADAGSGSG